MTTIFSFQDVEINEIEQRINCFFDEIEVF